jgi:molybdate transport system permease protein
MEEAFRFCTDLLVLDHGGVIARGAKHQLFESPGTVAAARLTGCKNIVAAVPIAANRINVPAWNCELTAAKETKDGLTHVGYRSHQVRFVEDASGENVFPCWLVSTSEAPHEMTLYLRLHGAPERGETAHLQADVAKDLWRVLNLQPQPWKIMLDPEKLLLLKG